ncbi:outer membrane protein assembly factor BamE [Gammaproteobacteria bacterium]|nr:outer membrane protein assembly factor BamE [Gammaproteobacteria bacterium]
MKQLTKAFLIIILSLGGVSSCSSLAPFKVAVLQGNIIEDEDVEQLVKGLSKDQVQYLLGTPLLNSPIHQNRWDYFYSIKVGETIVGEKKLSLIFDIDQRLDTWVLEETTLTDNN